MQILSSVDAPSFQDIARQSLHAAAHYRSQWMQHQLDLQPMQLSITPFWPEPHLFTIEHLPSNSRSNRWPAALSVISSDTSSERGSDVFSVQSASSVDNNGQLTPPFPPKLPSKQKQVRY